MINFEDPKILIGDGGQVIPQLQKDDKSRVDLWKLSDWIENMKSKSWLDEVNLKKYGHRKIACTLNNHYQELAIWLEYYLLDRKELYNKLFENDSSLIYLKPQADLMVASYSYIDKHFYPRFKWLWESVVPTSNGLWGLFEYSLCSSSLQKTIEGSNIKSKAKLLAKMGGAINEQQEWLEGVERKFKILSAGIVSNLPSTVTTPKMSNYIEDGKKLLQKIQTNPLANLHKLLHLQSELMILGGEHSLIKPYNQYLQEWKIYHQAAKASEVLQVMYLPDPNNDPDYSKKGQKIQHSKGFGSKRGRGRPPKGQSVQL